MEIPSSSRLRLAKTCRNIFAVAGFIVSWQLLVQFNVMKPLMFGNIPSPLEVVRTLYQVLSEKVYYFHVGSSFLRITAGSFLALVAAVPLGFLIGLSGIARDFIFPVFEIFRPIPQISWIPVAILLFPSVEGSIIFITFLGAFYPILINTIAGIAGVSPSLVTAAESMGATPVQLLRFVYFPGALPNIFTGFTVGVGVSWMSVIAAEMISGKYGVGYYTWTSYTLMAYAETIVGMITIGVMGAVCFAAIRGLERFCLKWREDKGR